MSRRRFRWDRAASREADRLDRLADFSTIERYWNDPSYRAEQDAERAANLATAHAAIDASMARYRARMNPDIQETTR